MSIRVCLTAANECLKDYNLDQRFSPTDIEDRERIGEEDDGSDTEEHDGSDTIVEAKLTSGILRITTKKQDSQGTIQCDMKLTGIDQAELRMLTPPVVTAPMPWKLDRAKVVNKTLTSSQPAAGQ